DDVRPAVAVDIRCHHEGGHRSGGQADWGPEGAIAVTLEHADVIAGAVADDQVRPAVAIDVCDGQAVRFAAGGDGFLSLKRAVAVAHQHAHAVDARVCGDD